MARLEADPQAPFRDAVLRTLDAMCQGGIYDHLGGGSRATRPMHDGSRRISRVLYDNAELDRVC